MLRGGDADIGLTIETVRPTSGDDSTSLRTHLLDDPFYLVLPSDHPQAKRRNIRLSEMADESWILGSTDASCPDGQVLPARVQQGRLRAADRLPVRRLQRDPGLHCRRHAASALIPDLALINVRNDVVVRSLGPKAPVRRISALTTESGFCSPAKQAMLDVLVETAGDWTGDRRELALAS